MQNNKSKIRFLNITLSINKDNKKGLSLKYSF